VFSVFYGWAMLFQCFTSSEVLLCYLQAWGFDGLFLAVEKYCVSVLIYHGKAELVCA
jgi:hypothetical protein